MHIKAIQKPNHAIVKVIFFIWFYLILYAINIPTNAPIIATILTPTSIDDKGSVVIMDANAPIVSPNNANPAVTDNTIANSTP